MRIAIISDLHLGFGWGTEREEDSFIQASEALEKAAARADVIIIPGDIFDTRNPRQEVIHRALNLFSRFKFSAAAATKLVDVKTASGERFECNITAGTATAATASAKPAATNAATTTSAKSGSRAGAKSSSPGARADPTAPPPGSGSAISLHATHELGIPIVAIHGTHDRRGRSFTNPVKLLEEAGHLIHLDGQTAVFEKAGERVAICGVAGVPEIFARGRFHELKPRPVSGATNILMFHQSIKGFVYMDEDNPTLTLEDLPRNFDLVVDGHIHWGGRTQLGISDVLIAGSTITTQVRKGEAGAPKKIYLYDTRAKKISEEALATPRPAFYFEIDAAGKPAADVRAAVKKELDALVDRPFEKKPLVRVRIVGRASETLGGFSEMTADFKERLLLAIKDDTSSDADAKKLEAARGFLDGSLDIEKGGVETLCRLASAEKLSFDVGAIFDLLAEERIEEAEAALLAAGAGAGTAGTRAETTENASPPASDSGSGPDSDGSEAPDGSDWSSRKKRQSRLF